MVVEAVQWVRRAAVWRLRMVAPVMANRRRHVSWLMAVRTSPYRQIPIRSRAPGTGEEVSGTKARVEISQYGQRAAALR